MSETQLTYFSNEVSLSWKEHSSSVCDLLSSIYLSESMTDCSIVANGKTFKAHQLVLSSSSQVLKTALDGNPDPHPSIILSHVENVEIERLLHYLYKGFVKIPKMDLRSFVSLMEQLKIKAMFRDKPQQKSTDAHKSQQKSGDACQNLQKLKVARCKQQNAFDIKQEPDCSGLRRPAACTNNAVSLNLASDVGGNILKRKRKVSNDDVSVINDLTG